MAREVMGTRARRVVTLACLSATALTTLAVGLHAQSTVRRCGLEFTLPGGWTIVPDPYVVEPECGLLLRPIAWDSLLVEQDSVDFFTILVRTSAVGFVQAVVTSAFELTEGAWWVNGRLGLRNEASAISRNGWQGVIGYGPFGCYRIGGGYAGVCDFPVALVGTHTLSAIIEGGPDDVFHAVLDGLRFVP